MNKDVVIVIPLSTRPGFTDSERISLLHLEHYLGNYDKFFIAPNDLKVEYDQIPIERFDDKYFGSLNAHTRLSLSMEFYERFSNYKFVLMYHTDCLVFNNNLTQWCELGYDFIGPPWIKGPDLPWLEENGVGNTGFSLRKIDSFLKLLNSRVRYQTLSEKIRKLSGKNIRSGFKNIAGYFIPGQNNIQKHIKIHIQNDGHDDRFIQKYAKKYNQEFKISPLHIALKFGFEANVKRCYELNENELPFGCHAWEKYDKDFWEPYLLEYRESDG